VVVRSRAYLSEGHAQSIIFRLGCPVQRHGAGCLGEFLIKHLWRGGVALTSDWGPNSTL
jgi:hypothetical protein